ncbi:MAG: UPF0149 family protein [Hyphomicrobiaceae bacterium]
MTVDDIIHTLKTAETLPKDALRAGVAEAQTLAPTILALAEKTIRGVYPLPDDQRFLFYGLHILAAASEKRLCPLLLEFACLPEEDRPRLCDPYDLDDVPYLVLSVYDGNATALLAAIQNPDIDADMRWTLFEVLARLTCDGKIARAETQAFLEWFERIQAADDDDLGWIGWAYAVVNLGFVELEPALRRVDEKVALPPITDARLHERLERLAAAAADPSDPSRFDEGGISPVTDPVKALWQLEEDADAEPADDDDEVYGDDDPALKTRLTPGEMEWLDGFLTSNQAPETAMDLEMVDGFFTALAIGPESVPPSEYLPEIWGPDGDEEPNYDSAEQAQYVAALLMRHGETVSARLKVEYPHIPLLAPFFDGLTDAADPIAAEDWAVGFLHGVAMRDKSWKRRVLSMDEDTARQFSIILMLADDDSLPDDHVLTDEERADFVEDLPLTILRLNYFLRNRKPVGQPERSVKIGRNQPCPCGSGKKYKYCCGSGRTPSVH